MKNFLLAAGLLASSVSAHMQMSEPFPIRSPLNKDNNGKKDYSYTNPLSTDGSDFPCKGYADDPFNATANYNPGGSYPLKLAGSATHKGGSCQISLSYDQGKTFQVIHSILGGCPIDKEYKFTVPSDVPSGEALLAWSWFNKVGNREMYMNCAQVNIGSKGGSQSREMVSNADNDDIDANNATTRTTDAQSFDSLPPIFIANVNGPGKCETVEGKDVNFPKPGPSVEGSVEGKGYKCDGDADFLASDSGSSTTSSSNSTESSSSHNSNAPDNANAPMSSSILDYQREGGIENKHPVAFGTTASEPRFGPPTGAPAPQGQAAHGHGHGQGHGHGGKPHNAWGPPGGIACSPDGKNFSLFTADGSPIAMGSVAAGTICRDDKITWA
ncbi:putative extracellular protein [Aspergillus glaucus CBS 516.65]|uniref:Chitin-binding type-4 domain-containing protein n=1 Tax=Aspergillus glaucus CBS 516.65 TaxID=1160497 RepID=A0A1L9VWK4_ASPGL|nr:hypothetical protein ASPGLDRAFT_31447 [Aspergillus glaucus CBS 516.65]OJJ88279.1 hypothetical protein ASPGLDRAFT_31447 [Aspergillus glaucus CBS 516.65]